MPTWEVQDPDRACISPKGRSHTGAMPSSLAIGDFSRATHLNVKTLRHYHRIGLLVPAEVDAGTGHRRYGTDQIPTAQVIRRFRSLDMPLEEVQAVITTTDLEARNELIASHLRRLEDTLARTQDAAASLRDLLEPPIDAVPLAIEHRRIAATPAVTVSEVIDVRDASAWYQGALGELYAILAVEKTHTPKLRAAPSTPTISLHTGAAKPPSSSLALTSSGPPDG